MSHTSLTYHIIFSTFRRTPSIVIDHERELYKFLYDLAGRYGAKVWRIGGMPDHIHMLCDIPAKISVADFARILKSESSKFMKVNPHFPNWHGWGDGYGCFSVDASQRASRIGYIMGQKEHHRKFDFAEEYRKILLEAGIESFGEK